MPAPFAIAQPARARTLRFVPQANLTLLDPIFTTALVTINHGWAIYDTLFGADIKQNLKLENGVVAMDLPVDLSRPRRRGDARTAEIEGRILDRLLRPV
jgi:hypothetical protein